jgi:hypothetical protein
MESQFTSLLSLFNKVFIQLLSSFDQEIFASILSKDYNMISFFSEVYNSKQFLEDRELLLTTGIGGGGGSHNHQHQLTSASVMSSHPLNSHSVFSSASVSSLPPLMTATEPSMISTTAKGTGKKLSFENVPAGLKGLRHSSQVEVSIREKEKEYLSFSRPLLLSKSLDSLNAASLASNMSLKGVLPSINQNDGIDYTTLQSNIDRFLKAKASKQSSLTFTDSMNFPETSGGGGGGGGGGSFSLAAAANQQETEDEGTSAEKPTTEQEQQDRPSEAPSLFSPAKRGPSNNSEFSTWKSDLDAILRSVDNTFRETIHHLLSQLLTTDPFEKKTKQEKERENGGKSSSSSRPASRQKKQYDDHTGERATSSSSKFKRKEIKDKMQHQQLEVISSDQASIKLSDHITFTEDDTDVARVDTGSINWSSLDLSLSLMVEKFQKIFVTLLKKYQTNYHSLLSCIEYENYLLMKSLKHLRLHSSVMKGSVIGGGGGRGEGATDESTKEKVFSLETKVDSLLSKITENELKPINGFISELLVSNELEKSLKFLILIIKQKIAKEQHSLQVFLEKEAEGVMPSGTEGFNEEGMNTVIDEEKEIRGRKHYITSLKNALVDHEQRLKLVKEESSSLINSIYEIIEKFHSSLQSSLPSKLLNSLLHRSQNYFEKYQRNPRVLSEMSEHSTGYDLLLSLESPTERSVTATSVMKTGGNKTLLSPLRQQAGPVSGSYTKREKSRERPLSSNSSAKAGGSRTSSSVIGSMPSASSTNQFSNRYKHQNNEQFEKVNKFFDQTYRKSKY